jgi:hypothetical protein
MGVVEKKRVVLVSIIYLALVILISPALAEDKTPFKPMLSVKLTGGWGSDLPGNDMNRVLESFNNMRSFVLYREFYPELISGEIKALDSRIPEWHLEFRLDLNRRIGLAFGISMPFQKSNENTINWEMTVGQRHSFTIRPRIQTLPPLTWSVYYNFLPDSKLSLQLNLGAGLYLARLSEYYKLEVTPPETDTDWLIRYWETRYCGTIAPHAGVEIDLKLTKKAALVAEAQWRYANIRDFNGTITYEGKSPGSYREDSGDLYYYTREEFYTGDRYADLTIPRPEGLIEFPAGIRRTALDMSGWSIRFGLRVNL